MRKKKTRIPSPRLAGRLVKVTIYSTDIIQPDAPSICAKMNGCCSSRMPFSILYLASFWMNNSLRIDPIFLHVSFSKWKPKNQVELWRPRVTINDQHHEKATTSWSAGCLQQHGWNNLSYRSIATSSYFNLTDVCPHPSTSHVDSAHLNRRTLFYFFLLNHFWWLDSSRITSVLTKWIKSSRSKRMTSFWGFCSFLSYPHLGSQTHRLVAGSIWIRKWRLPFFSFPTCDVICITK